MHPVRFTRRHEIEQRVRRTLVVRTALIEAEIEEEILFRKSKVLEQQHVSRMDVRGMRQHVVVGFQSDWFDRIGAEVDGRGAGDLEDDVVNVAEQQLIKRLHRHPVAVQVKPQAVNR